MRTGRQAILATFAVDGAEMCNELPVLRYGAGMLTELVGEGFELLRAADSTHHQPWGDPTPTRCSAGWHRANGANRFDGERFSRLTTDTTQLDNGRLSLWGIRNPVRGLLHGVAAGLALAGAAGLAIEAPSTAGRLGVLTFGAGMTALFLTSSLYHSVPWSPAAMRRMRRLDHSMIFILISATFTPFGLLALDGWLKVSSLVAAWSLAGIGIAAVVTTSGTANGRRVGAMIGLGWLSALVAVPVGRQVGLEAVALLAAGGAIYSTGGLIFAYRWPRLWPRVFSYHEVFHTLVVLAALLHFVAVCHFLLPVAATRA